MQVVKINGSSYNLGRIEKIAAPGKAATTRQVIYASGYKEYLPIKEADELEAALLAASNKADMLVASTIALQEAATAEYAGVNITAKMRAEAAQLLRDLGVPSEGSSDMVEADLDPAMLEGLGAIHNLSPEDVEDLKLHLNLHEQNERIEQELWAKGERDLRRPKDEKPAPIENVENTEIVGETTKKTKKKT